MLPPEVQSEYASALAEVGPSITKISAWTRRSIRQVKEDMSQDEQLRTLYNNSVSMVLDAIDRFGGNLTILARMFEVPRHVVESWIADDPRLRVAFYDFNESIVDIAEHGIFLAVQAGHPWAIRQVLTTKGADRGWGERHTVDISSESQRLGVNLEAAIRELANNMASQTAGYIEGEVAEDS